MTKSKRNGEIELFRFLCAIIIMLRHCKGIISGGFGDISFARGALAVEFFFIVSGYLMAVSAKKNAIVNSNLSIGKDTTLFMKRKYCGLMPEFLFAWVISFVIAQSFGNFSMMEVVRNASIWIFELIPISIAGWTGGEFHMAAWYISAMLLAMFILYPICRKHFDTFTRIIAPLLAIFIIGFMIMNYNSTLGPTDNMFNLTYKGFPRAIAEISLGAALYPAIEYLKAQEFTKGKKLLVTALTFIFALSALYWMAFGKTRNYDVLCLVLIASVVLLSFTHQGYFADKFDNKFCCWLGKISMVLYLCHGEWAKVVTKAFKEQVASGAIEGTTTDRLIALAIFFALSFLTVFIVYQLSKLIRKSINKKKVSA